MATDWPKSEIATRPFGPLAMTAMGCAAEPSGAAFARPSSDLIVGSFTRVIAMPFIGVIARAAQRPVAISSLRHAPSAYAIPRLPRRPPRFARG